MMIKQLIQEIKPKLDELDKACTLIQERKDLLATARSDESGAVLGEDVTRIAAETHSTPEVVKTGIGLFQRFSNGANEGADDPRNGMKPQESVTPAVVKNLVDRKQDG